MVKYKEVERRERILGQTEKMEEKELKLKEIGDLVGVGKLTNDKTMEEIQKKISYKRIRAIK